MDSLIDAGAFSILHAIKKSTSMKTYFLEPSPLTTLPYPCKVCKTQTDHVTKSVSSQRNYNSYISFCIVQCVECKNNTVIGSLKPQPLPPAIKETRLSIVE